MESFEVLIAGDREDLLALLGEAIAYAHTRTNLARELGVSHQVVGAWLSGRGMPTLVNQRRLRAWLRGARRRFGRCGLQAACSV